MELISFVKIEVSDPGTTKTMKWIKTNTNKVKTGSFVYTSWLNEVGQIKSDLTKTRQAGNANGS